MAKCKRIIGRHLPHPCDRQITGANPPPIEDDRCTACGIVITATQDKAVLDYELGFSDAELAQFSVHMNCPNIDDCNPPEWGENSYSSFT